MSSISIDFGVIYDSIEAICTREYLIMTGVIVLSHCYLSKNLIKWTKPAKVKKV
jgi:hypothetical protein